MNSISRERLLNHFSYNWFFYVGSLLAIIIFWTWVFSMLAKVPLNEKITIFIGAYGVDENMNTEILENLQGIREVEIHCEDPKGDMFPLLLQTRGIINTDIIILPESAINDEILPMWFREIDETVLREYLPDMDYDYYETGVKKYGLLAYDAEKKLTYLFPDIIFASENTEEENFYLFLNKESVNLGKLNINEKANQEDDAALRLLAYLFGKEE